MIIGGVGLVSTVLSVSIAWSTLDLPRPALNSELKAASIQLELKIAGLENFSKGTHRLVLGQQRDRLEDRIDKLKAKQNKSRDDKDYLKDLERRLRTIKEQLKGLK